MSAGAFTNVAYASIKDPTKIYNVRVQPETTGFAVTVAGANAVNLSGQPNTAINQPYSARVSGSRRGRGLKLGTIRFKFVDASGVPGNYLQGSTLSLPVLNPTILSAPEGATGTYLGSAVVVVGTSSESGK